MVNYTMYSALNKFYKCPKQYIFFKVSNGLIVLCSLILLGPFTQPQGVQTGYS